jgi:hypothetical protein
VAVPEGRSRAFVFFQDAAVEGTNFPALGAYSHGVYWVFPISDKVLKLLSIAPLELLALLGSIVIFGPTMPTPGWRHKYEILLQSDSLTSTWKLQEGGGKAPIMEFIFDLLISSDEYNRLKPVLTLGHVFGEGNPMADNLSRGDLKLFMRTCELLDVTPRRLEPSAAFHNMVRQVCEYAATLPSRST